VSLFSETICAFIFRNNGRIFFISIEGRAFFSISLHDPNVGIARM
jgi:hypothetical protein